MVTSSIPPVVRVLEQCWVSPSGDGLPAIGEVSLPLTFFDIIWFGGHPVQRLFFYQWPVTTPNFISTTLPSLKRSLSIALRRYYPLAGRLRPLPGSDDKFEVYCTDGDSVPFTVAECGREYFGQLAGDHAHAVGTLRPLVPDIPASDGGPLGLMALQVTVFPGAGVSVGVSIHHTACDGSGFTNFVKAWASACRSAEDAAALQVTDLPVIDRALVSDPKGLYTVFYDGMKKLLDVGFSVPTVESPAVVRSTFLIRRAHIEKLRLRVSQWRPPPPPSFRYSSFVVVCAYVWVCLLKAREQPPPEAGDAAYFLFAVDCRARLRPPLPPAYFGNCLGACFVDARRSDLVGDDGVGLAAEAIAESVGRLGTGGEVLQGAEEWITKAVERLPGRPLSIAGSPKFGVYGVDFGWGRPAKVEVVGIEKTGAMALAESRENEGGIEVGMALPAPEMAKFSSLFAAGLEDMNTEA